MAQRNESVVMYSLDVSEAPQRAVHSKELLSLILMLLPFISVLLFILVNPGVWTSNLAVFFSQDREILRSDSGWILSTLALVAALLCAWVGAMGTRESWKYNRRWQRGFLGALAVTLMSVLFSGWSMTTSINDGHEPEASLAMFATMCAPLYGVLCAVISPRDNVYAWYEEDPGHDDEEPAPRPG